MCNFLYYKLSVAVGSLMLMASGFGPEGPGSILDSAKDPPSKCGELARKIRGSENRVVGL